MTKYAGRGFTVSVNAGSALPQLREFGAFGSSRNLIDATSYGDDWTDFVTGLQDGDEVAFMIAYDPNSSDHDDLIDLYENTDGRLLLTVVHDGSGFNADIEAIVNALRRESPIDGLLALAGTFKIVNPGVVAGGLLADVTPPSTPGTPTGSGLTTTSTHITWGGSTDV